MAVPDFYLLQIPKGRMRLLKERHKVHDMKIRSKPTPKGRVAVGGVRGK